ncbi:O-methyltransferase [Sorangium cellulosum]|uniref:O-methyltransferase n=2 Tax=Polyangiaceae TaxID=49 RepID=A0A4P2QJC3_SORCE|nr:O-methyltransferase [Sorangium cellulosum]WCQ89110.1 Mitomycin biosynthesis 6-O-methyltransferase [Sorangium sp. Soce836]
MQETTLFGGLSVDDPGKRLGQLVDGFLATQVVAVIARLGVPDHMAGTARTAEELATATGADPDALGRLLHAAMVFGLLTRDEGGRFALTEMGALLRTDTPGSLRDLVVGFATPPLWQAVGRLADVVRTGRGGDENETWSYYRRHPEEARWLARGMSRITSRLSTEVAAAYDASGFDRIVDVGGGRGTLLAAILRRAPRAAGVLFDLSETLAEAPTLLAEGGLADRTQIVAGSFFDAVPAGGDLYVISQVLHNWDDERARTIIERCHQASRAGGTLLVIEPLLPCGPQASPMHLLDVLTLVGCGGRERTREQLQSLLAAAGYTLARTIPLSQDFLPWHMLECRRT